MLGGGGFMVGGKVAKQEEFGFPEKSIIGFAE